LRGGRWPHAFISFGDARGSELTLAWGVGHSRPTELRRPERKR